MQAVPPRQLEPQVAAMAARNGNDSPYPRQLDSQVAARAAPNANDSPYPGQLDSRGWSTSTFLRLVRRSPRLVQMRRRCLDVFCLKM